MTERIHDDTATDDKAVEEARTRREFLGRCGKYAAATAPAVTLMLSAANKPALAGNRYGSQIRRRRRRR